VELIADIATTPAYVTVRCKGRFLCDEDMESVARNIVALHPTPTLVLVDLSQLECIPITQVGILWLRYMEANARGWKLAFVRMPDHLNTLLRDCGLEDSIPAFESETQAASAFASGLARAPARRRSSAITRLLETSTHDLI
jgi:anti-anti-sigma regulatory factor